MAGISLLSSAPGDIPTPAAGKVTIFFDTDTGLPSYKDDAGAVSPLGATGPQGPQATSYFPGGWI